MSDRNDWRDLLADIRDLLDERLPSGVHPGGQANELNNTDEGAGEPITVHDDEPADLPGEPVEPGDLRAGDKVSFMLDGVRITRSLVNIHDDAEWCRGITDLRLIERAPREDEDPDEALAKDIQSAYFGGDETSWRSAARAAREHIEGERNRSWMEGSHKWRGRAKKAEADVERLTRERDEWKAKAERVDDAALHWMKRCHAAEEKAETERDEWEDKVERLGAMFFRACAERDKWKVKSEQADDLYSRARNERDEAEAERDRLRGACDSWQSAAQEAEYLSEKFRDERDEWKAKFEQIDDLYSRALDERDEARQDVKNAKRETEQVKQIEKCTRERHAALREDVKREHRDSTTGDESSYRLFRILARDAERGRS